MVEAPGTAPGSETLMPRGVYRHSRLADTTNIGIRAGRSDECADAAFTIKARRRDSRDEDGACPDRPAGGDRRRARARAATRRPTVPALEAMLYQAIPVLDHGFVRVIDYMGDDAAIVQAARVSYGRGTRR